MLTRDKTYKEEHRIVLESLNDFSHGFCMALSMIWLYFLYPFFNEKKFFKNFKQISPQPMYLLFLRNIQYVYGACPQMAYPKIYILSEIKTKLFVALYSLLI